MELQRSHRSTNPELNLILDLLLDLHWKVDILMLDDTALLASAQALVAEAQSTHDAVEGAVTAINDLKAKIGTGSTETITQADLDGIGALLTGATSTLQSAGVDLAASLATNATPDPSAAPVVAPLYEHVTATPFDDTVWLDSGLVAADGTTLFTFTGDAGGSVPTGAGPDWAVYTGATTPKA